MITKYRNILRQRWRWMRYANALDRMTSLDQFRVLVTSLNEPVFRNHEEWGQLSQGDCPAVLDALRLSMEGKTFFDVGPGYGAALDVAKVRGASGTYFVDYDPFMCTFNRLKGHRGVRLDIRTELGRLAPKRFDFIWSKATFTVDRFLARENNPWQSTFSKYPRLIDLLRQLDALVAPGGVILFCPHWDYVDKERKIKDVKHGAITEIFLQHGYEILPWIDGHNREPVYPITFLKRTFQQ